jgi:hypothetical protein
MLIAAQQRNVRIRSGRTRLTALKVSGFVLRVAADRGIGCFGLDEESPKEQDAQDQQNGDYDNLDYGHGWFLGVPKANQMKTLRQIVVIVEVHNLPCQTKRC